ncbi:MAG TPA: lysophospholipid acyltransferase family protein [Candidatus Hydrogenedentes bacterium]|mgnify:CR=1 FL=1|nr:lysophospholipid acyltransferase family protein [Candidatus Hydrogenedentota bacterium]
MRFLKIAYLNLAFYAAFFAFSLAAIPALTLFMVLCALVFPRRYVMKRLRRVISWWGWVVIHLYVLSFSLVQIKHEGIVKRDAKGPFIFVCNHRSVSDAFYMALLPLEVVQVVNVWPFRIPILGIVAKLAGYISLWETPFEEFAAKTSQLLRDGVSIVAFPEGTRSRDQLVGQFHSAIFRVALETKIPIVPLCITGSENIPPIGSLLLRPGCIRIRQLTPIAWEEYGHMNPYTLKNHMRQIIIDETAVMEK